MEEEFLNRMRTATTNRGKDEAISDMKRMSKCKTLIKEINDREKRKEESTIEKKNEIPTS